MPAGAAEAFVAKCRQLKLDFVVFVRHASSAPLRAGQPATARAEDHARRRRRGLRGEMP